MRAVRAILVVGLVVVASVSWASGFISGRADRPRQPVTVAQPIRGPVQP